MPTQVRLSPPPTYIRVTAATASLGLRDWLEWPVNRFDILPEGALFFACQGTGWGRQQLWQAALLGAMQVEGVRLVVYGFPWSMIGLNSQEQIVAGNGRLMPDSARVLVASRPAAAARLAARFLNGNPLLAENLERLRPGDGILVDQGDIRLVSWTKKGYYEIGCCKITTIPLDK